MRASAMSARTDQLRHIGPGGLRVAMVMPQVACCIAWMVAE